MLGHMELFALIVSFGSSFHISTRRYRAVCSSEQVVAEVFCEDGESIAHIRQIEYELGADFKRLPITQEKPLNC